MERTHWLQNWDNESAISFNVQLLNATRFEQLLGIRAPPTPITEAVYEAHGYPFYNHYLESTGLKDDISYADRGYWSPLVVSLNEEDARTLFLPVAEVEAAFAEWRSAESAEDGEGI